MKNFIFLFVALLATMCVTTSCSSDSNDEPTVTSLPNTAWVLESSEEWDNDGDYTYDDDELYSEIYVFNVNGTISVYGPENNFEKFQLVYNVNGNTLTFTESYDNDNCIYTGEYKIADKTMFFDAQAYWVDEPNDASRIRMKFKEIQISEVDYYLNLFKSRWEEAER